MLDNGVLACSIAFLATFGRKATEQQPFGE